jgi:hypothetical protein
LQKYYSICARFEVLTTLIMQITVVWLDAVQSGISLSIYWIKILPPSSGLKTPENGDGAFLGSVSNDLPDSTTSYPRRHQANIYMHLDAILAVLFSLKTTVNENG